MLAERMVPPHKENGHGIAQQNKAMALIPLICRSFCRYKYAKHWKSVHFVDQEGLEPSSKQGNNMLSTRLSLTWFSSAGKTSATNQHLIL